MLFFGYAFIQRVAPSVMTDELMAEFAVGAGSLGILSGAYFYAYAALQLPVGLMTDRYGPRKLMSAAIILCAIASFGFANSESLFSATLYRALIGGSVAFGFVGTLSIIAQFFRPVRFAMLAGLVQSTGMLGAMLGQAPLALVVEQQGWQRSFVWMAAVAIVLGILLFFFVPRRQAEAHADAGKQSLRASLVGVAGNPQSWLCAGIGFGLAAPMLSFAGLWAIPWLGVAYGLDRSAAAPLASTLFAGWAIGSPLAGWVSDRQGLRRPVMFWGALISLLTLSLLVYLSYLPVWMIASLFFINGLAGSTMVVVFGSVREVNHPVRAAAAMGLANMCVVGSGAVTQPLMGWLLDLSWGGQIVNNIRVYQVADFRVAVAALIVTLVISLLCVVMLKETYCKNQLQSDLAEL